MSGWYEVSKSISGQFRFLLKAANAEQAEANAHITSGKNVLRVERIEERAEA